MTDFAIQVLTAPIGKTHLFSVGQAGFIIKSAGGQLLAMDLYLSDCVERVEGNAGFKRLLPKILCPMDLQFDAVVATHFHRDHFDIDAVPSLMSNGKTRLFASEDCPASAPCSRFGTGRRSGSQSRKRAGGVFYPIRNRRSACRGSDSKG